MAGHAMAASNQMEGRVKGAAGQRMTHEGLIGLVDSRLKAGLSSRHSYGAVDIPLVTSCI